MPRRVPPGILGACSKPPNEFTRRTKRGVDGQYSATNPPVCIGGFYTRDVAHPRFIFVF